MKKPLKETNNPILLLLALEKRGLITREESHRFWLKQAEKLGKSRWGKKKC